jgi:hypothetical protein
MMGKIDGGKYGEVFGLSRRQINCNLALNACVYDWYE